MTPLIATWSIQLWTECPKCEQDVDLLDYCDFWDGRKLEIGENGTDRSASQEVLCPKCSHEFTVECVY